MENFIIKGSRKRVLFLTTLSFFVGFAGVSAYGPVIPLLKKTLSLSPLLTGFLVAIPALTGSLLRIPFGAMVDKIGGKKPLLILLCTAMLGIIGIAWLMTLEASEQSVRYRLFIIFGMLAGCGIATFSVGVPAVSYWHPQKSQGRALALYGGLGNTAPGIFAILMPLLITAYGFLASYAVWIGLIFTVICLLIFFMHDAPSFQLRAKGHDRSHAVKFGQELLPSGKVVQSLTVAATDRNTWILTGIYFVTFGGFIALTSWFPIYWSQSFGLSMVIAGTFTAVYSVSASVIRVAGGFVSDKLGGEKTLKIALPAMLAGALVMIFSNVFYTAVFGAVIMAFGMGTGNAAVFKLVPKFAPKTVGGSAGIVGGLGAFGGFIIPIGLGWTAGAYSYSKAFYIFAALAILGFALLFGLKKEAAK